MHIILSLPTHHTPDLSISPSLHPLTTHLSIHSPTHTTKCSTYPSTHPLAHPFVYSPHPPICQPILMYPLHPSTCLSIALPIIYLPTLYSSSSIHQSIPLAIHLSTYIPDLSIYPFIHAITYPSICPFISQPITDPCNLPLIYPSVHLTTYLSSHLPTHPHPHPIHIHPHTYLPMFLFHSV